MELNIIYFRGDTVIGNTRLDVEPSAAIKEALHRMWQDNADRIEIRDVDDKLRFEHPKPGKAEAKA